MTQTRTQPQSKMKVRQAINGEKILVSPPSRDGVVTALYACPKHGVTAFIARIITHRSVDILVFPPSPTYREDRRRVNAAYQAPGPINGIMPLLHNSNGRGKEL